MPKRLDELPHTEVESLLDAELPVVAILPVGATEAHGPHLPLNTDVVISEAFAMRSGELLEQDGSCRALLLPSLAYTPAGYASNFAGTFSLTPEVYAGMLNSIASAVAKQSFACLALANSHFDPQNVGELRKFSERWGGLGLKVAYADATRRKLAQELTDEFKSGDCHGGQFETSIVLAARPDLVRYDAAKALPDNQANLIGAIQRKGADARFEDLNMPNAYCGSPAGATVEEGRQSIETLAIALAGAVREVL